MAEQLWVETKPFVGMQNGQVVVYSGEERVAETAHGEIQVAVAGEETVVNGAKEAAIAHEEIMVAVAGEETVVRRSLLYLWQRLLVQV